MVELSQIIFQLSPLATIASFCVVSMAHTREEFPKASGYFFSSFVMFLLCIIFTFLSIVSSDPYFKNITDFGQVFSFIGGIGALTGSAIELFKKE